MKNLIIALLLVVGVSTYAQDKAEMSGKSKRAEMGKMTPEQRNQLMVKKMTLNLDLNSKQQAQAGQIIAEQNTRIEAIKAERMAKKQSRQKANADERFEMKNKMLNEQKAMKEKMKSILSPEQFEKWKNLKEKHQEKFIERRKENKNTELKKEEK